MKIRQIAVTFFCVFLFLLVYSPSVAQAEETAAAKSELWWPFEETDPPELIAFGTVFERTMKRQDVFPLLKFDYFHLGLGFIPEIIADEKSGVPVQFGIEVEVSRRFDGKDVVRQYLYHRIWTADIEKIFRDTSFLNRTPKENRELAAYDNTHDYQQRVQVAIEDIVVEQVEQAVRACASFREDIIKNTLVGGTLHRELDAFATRVEHIFSKELEPFLGQLYRYSRNFYIIRFDYDFSQDWFTLKVVVHDQMFLIGKERTVDVGMERRILSLKERSYSARHLAKQAFRALSELLAGEKR